METGKALVEALVFGKLDGLDDDSAFLFARTGLVHLFSASGFHLWMARKAADILAARVLPFVKNSRAREGVRLFARLLLMAFFANATDWSSPMVRAFTFATLSASARAFEVRENRHWVFLVSLLVSAGLGRGSPLSFLLSACSMAGVLYVQPRSRWALALGPWLFTLPVSVYCFGEFPLLAPLWNLTFGLAISWIVLPLALLALVAETLGLPSPALNGANAWLMLQLVNGLRLAADTAGLAYWVRPLPWALLSGALLGAYWLWRRGRRKTSLAAVVCSAALLGVSPIPALSVLDVGQGDSVLVRTPTRSVLTDVGPPGHPGRAAPAAVSLEKLGVGDLDDVLLTHFDLDHRGGLDSLLARHRFQGALWFREEDLEEKHAATVLAAAERAALPVRFVDRRHAPDGFECWLAPFRKGNDSCPLCRARLAGARDVLLTGDMSEKAETWFVQTLRPFPQATFLKVAHHGSASSSSDTFLEASGARFALISVGAKNRYHHPAPETLARLAREEMHTLRTDELGTVNLYPWQRILSYLSLGFFTEESTRPEPSASRPYPGIPAFARRAYTRPALVK